MRYSASGTATLIACIFGAGCFNSEMEWSETTGASATEQTQTTTASTATSTGTSRPSITPVLLSGSTDKSLAVVQQQVGSYIAAYTAVLTPNNTGVLNSSSIVAPPGVLTSSTASNYVSSLAGISGSPLSANGPTALSENLTQLAESVSLSFTYFSPAGDASCSLLPVTLSPAPSGSCSNGVGAFGITRGALASAIQWSASSFTQPIYLSIQPSAGTAQDALTESINVNGWGLSQVSGITSGDDAIDHIISIGQKLIFSAKNSGGLRKLFVLDQSNTTPQIIQFTHLHSTGDDVVSGDPIVELNGQVYFAGYTSTGVNRLFRYNPTPHTLDQVTSLNAGTDNIRIVATNQSDTLYFTANAPGLGYLKLYAYTPSTNTLQQISDTKTAGSDNVNYVVYDPQSLRLYFTAQNSSGYNRLYAYETATHTLKQISDIHATGDTISSLIITSGRLYFSAPDTYGYSKLYEFNPAISTYGQIRQIASLTANHDDPQSLTVIGGKIYFSANNISNYRKLFEYDPATQVMRQITDLNTSGSDNPAFLISNGTLLYFQATAGVAGHIKLFRYDPITNQLTQLSNTFPAGSDQPIPLIAGADGGVFFRSQISSGVFKLFLYSPWMNSVQQMSDVQGSSSADDNPTLMTRHGSMQFALSMKYSSGSRLFILKR